MHKSLKTNLISVFFIVLGTIGFSDYANANVVSNIQTGKSCDAACAIQNQVCANTGINSTADNHGQWVYYNGKITSTNFPPYGYYVPYDPIFNAAYCPLALPTNYGENCQCAPSPSAPTLSLLVPGNLQIVLNWMASVDSDIAGYNIYRSTTAGGELPVAVFTDNGAGSYNTGVYNTGIPVGNVTSYTDTGLTNGTTYYYKIATRNSAGAIGIQQSNEMSAVPTVPTCIGADPDTCTSWGSCTNGTKTCTGSYTKIPSGCTGGSVSPPTQSCASGCSSFTYSDWSVCSGGSQNRTVLTKIPDNCLGGIVPDLSRSCSLSQATPGTYEVYADKTTGMFSGYAWSENIGWIKFGGLSAFPTGSGTTPQNAQLEYLDYSGSGVGATQANIVGWARACAGTLNGDCSKMDSRSDGWDGWISLNGSSLDGKSGYGVSLKGDGVTLSGYAWGSDVIGWIDFTGVKLSAVPNASVTVSFTNTKPIPSVLSGGSVNIAWTSAGASTCTTTKNIEGLSSEIFSTLISSTGTSSKALTKNTTFIINCKSATGATASDSITVNVTNSCTGADVASCSAWGACQVDKTQTCTGTFTKLPLNCTGSVSAPTKSCGGGGGSCTGSGCPCSGFEYSEWEPKLCSTGQRTRSAVGVPTGCSGGETPKTTQSCTPGTLPCESYKYSDWGNCTNKIQTRIIESSIPNGCTGGVDPELSQSCGASAVSSTCVPSDEEIYNGKMTTWIATVNPSSAVVNGVNWSGTDIPETYLQGGSGLKIYKIYDFTGPISINAKINGTIKGLDGADYPFSSLCSTTTTVRGIGGTGSEI